MGYSNVANALCSVSNMDRGWLLGSQIQWCLVRHSCERFPPAHGHHLCTAFLFFTDAVPALTRSLLATIPAQMQLLCQGTVLVKASMLPTCQGHTFISFGSLTPLGS